MIVFQQKTPTKVLLEYFTFVVHIRSCCSTTSNEYLVRMGLPSGVSFFTIPEIQND